MRILYVSQYFPPEIGAPAARVFELSREWVRAGHEVQVLTAFPHHPTGVKRPGDRGVMYRRENVEGIDVHRAYVYAAPNRGSVRRMLSYASFALSAGVLGVDRLPRPDVVLATSPQLLCALAGSWIARRFEVPFVFEVRDLWPESIVAVEALRPGPLISVLRRLAAHLYRSADRVVTVGEGYRRGIHERYGLPIEAMDVVPNGIDPLLFSPRARDNEVRRSLGWEGAFGILYLGTLGMAHGLDRVVEAARLLSDDSRFRFAFVGEGAEKEALKRQAAALRNVAFVDSVPKERVPDYYAACDLGIVTLRETPLFQEVLPSKLFEYLGMERPVLLGVGGEARRLIEDAGAGDYVASGDAPAIAAAIRRMAADPARLAEMGRRGRAHVLAQHDRRELARRYLDILSRAARSRGP